MTGPAMRARRTRQIGPVWPESRSRPHLLGLGLALGLGGCLRLGLSIGLGGFGLRGLRRRVFYRA